MAGKEIVYEARACPDVLIAGAGDIAPLQFGLDAVEAVEAHPFIVGRRQFGKLATEAFQVVVVELEGAGVDLHRTVVAVLHQGGLLFVRRGLVGKRNISDIINRISN